ncbi:MAG TPA: EamA family transporter [Candidatus Acidoferrales bacterium]|nr:EamA family transporter [Candidatus Acidoferrales bacterium]
MTLPARAQRYRTHLLILIMVCVGPLGDTFLSDGMKRIGAPSRWNPAVLFQFFERAFTSGIVWIGIILLIAFFSAYMLALTWADFSYVQPASAMAYGVVAVLGYFLLGESVTPTRWAGVALICLGVLIVGRTPPRTTGTV